MFSKYLFQSDRLGFRTWEMDDLPEMAAINSDPEVLSFFPGLYSLQQTETFIHKMQQQQIAKGFCYFAVDLRSTGEFIGFIGLSEQTYPADFTPCVDIGWRLAQKFWGQGLATEGAKRCLDYAFSQLELKAIYSVAPEINLPSINVMEKIGMKKISVFQHSLLQEVPHLRTCVLYRIDQG